VTCPFCDIDGPEIVWSSALSVAFRDRHPVSPGHTLLIPRRHVPTWWEADPEEQADLLEGLRAVKERLDASLDPRPDGYNIGINAGEAAGQTVMHLHVHLIPRRRGDTEDPRGGVRGVIPGKQRYPSTDGVG